jgi:thioredoxin-like negative regulator of GroEL
MTTLILYFSPNCMHCINFKPEFEKVKHALDEMDMKDVKVELVDITQNRDKLAALEVPISGVPHVVLFVNGKQYVYEGNRTVESLIEFVKKHRSVAVAGGARKTKKRVSTNGSRSKSKSRSRSKSNKLANKKFKVRRAVRGGSSKLTMKQYMSASTRSRSASKSKSKSRSRSRSGKKTARSAKHPKKSPISAKPSQRLKRMLSKLKK